MLPGTFTFRRWGIRVAAVTLVCAAAFPADAPITPLTVCEVARNLSAQEGKDLAVLGRYSFRANEGLSLGEQSCDPAADAPPRLLLVENSKDAPKPPGSYELDAAALRRKLAEIQKRTQLSRFRFGTPDYDRWAVVYGRLEVRKSEESAKFRANLVFRGDGVVVFLRPEQ